MHISSQCHVQWPPADSLTLAMVGLFTWKELANTELFFLESMLLNIYQHTTDWALRIETRACWELRGGWPCKAGLTSLQLWLSWSHSRRKANTGTKMGRTVAESTTQHVGWPLQAQGKLDLLKCSFRSSPVWGKGKQALVLCAGLAYRENWEAAGRRPTVQTGPFVMKSHYPF